MILAKQLSEQGCRSAHVRAYLLGADAESACSVLGFRV